MVDPADEAEKPKQEQLPLNFGKRLAHTDKKIRDRGFANLKAFLHNHTELERLDFLKLWRGLYFGMWMADKRPVQQDLAVQMALLIEKIPREKQGMWLDTFWETMKASWEKLDKHRLSKYLLLIRIVVAEAFKVVRLGGWQTDEVKALSETFLQGVPRHVQQGMNTRSLGLNLQFHRILWDELRPQLKKDPEASVEVILELLEPFCALAEGCGLTALVKNVHKFVLLRTPQRFTGKLIFRLLQGAARKDIPKVNREALYETVDKLEKRPQAEVEEPGDEEEKPRPQAQPMKKRKRRRSAEGGAAAAPAEGAAEGAEGAEAASAAAPEEAAGEAGAKVPAKAKKQRGGDAPPTVAEEAEAAPSAPAKGKRRRANSGPSDDATPEAAAAAAPGGAAPKGPPR